MISDETRKNFIEIMRNAAFGRVRLSKTMLHNSIMEDALDALLASGEVVGVAKLELAVEAEAFNPTMDDRMGKFVPLDTVLAIIQQHTQNTQPQAELAGGVASTEVQDASDDTQKTCPPPAPFDDDTNVAVKSHEPTENHA